MAELRPLPFDEPLAERLAIGPGDGISLYWLGQAGFVIDAAGKRIIIDPYLSDSLAAKYRDTPFSHARMAPAPVTPDQLGPVDLVLSTHHHTDHMDGETLARLASRLPELKFVVPATSTVIAMQRIDVGPERLIAVDAGEVRTLEGVRLDIFRAAHETIERDEQGKHRFLGYGMTIAGRRIFHSGDTIPFEGQAEEIGGFAPDLALLPVNGRSEALSGAGFAGNFSLTEAIAFCENLRIGMMIAHHFDMFAFNTISPIQIDKAAVSAPFHLERARYQVEFRLDAA